MSTTKLKSCCIVGCKNQNIGADSGVIFYKFPEERKLKASWIEACKKNDALKDKKWEPSAGAVICNVHFVSGQKSPHDWHPDYVPSVFRSLRRNIAKKKGRFFDDSDEDSSSRQRLKTPTVKRLQQAGSAKRASVPTSPTSSKGKGATPGSVRKGRPPSTGGLRKPLRLTKKVKAGPKSKVLKNDEIIDLLDSPMKSPQSSNSFVDEEPDDKSNLSVFVLPENKRKYTEQDLEEDEPATPLKTLSVVLERTSEKRIKLTTGEITIKEEPLGDVDYILPQKIAPITKKVVPLSPKIYRPLKLPAKPVAKFRKSPLKDPCKNCVSLKQRVLDLEANVATNKVNEKCQRCPVIEHELKKVEEELEDIIESKLSKCQRCSLVEQKCKRVENNLRKAQTELSKVQNKLASIEICEETFKKYKSKVKLYTGFPNFDSLMLVFDHVKTRLPMEPSKGMSQFQMFILVMMRLKLNLPFWDLTYRFGASPNNIQSFYPLYINVLESTLSHVVLWPKANMQFRLQVLGSNLRQSFLVIQTPVKEETLMMPSANKMSEGDKVTRVCAALYHIAQLVSSNHSQQLVRILKSKDDLEKKPTEPVNNPDKISLSDDASSAPTADDAVTTPNTDKKTNGNNIEVLEKDASPVMNGEEDVDDSDIFFEDFTKDIGEGANSNDSLELECKHLRKELNNLTQKLSCQFKFYTGLRNFEVFNNLLGFLEPYVSHIKTERLSHFQQLHLVLIRYKLSLDVQDLAYMFNVDSDHVVYLTRVWTDVMSQQLKQYIEWSTGVEDAEGEKRLHGTVKLKYHMLWKPQLAPRNRDTNSDKEKLDMRKLLRACGSIYYIDDIEVIKDGVKENKIFSLLESAEKNSNEELEKECLTLRTEIYDLRKNIMSCISSCLNEESLQNNDLMVRYYTGFPSFEVLKNIFNLIFPTTKPENRKTISPFQQFLALLVRLKLNLSTHDIAYRFGMGQSNTHKLIQDWMVWLHTQLAPHITWPDDDEDVEVFTEMLRKTYAYLKNSISPRKNERKSETGFFDIATLVCAGLYNVGEVSFNKQSDSEFESFDEDW